MYAGTPKRLPPMASGLESKIEDENEDDYGKDCEKRALQLASPSLSRSSPNRSRPRRRSRPRCLFILHGRPARLTSGYRHEFDTIGPKIIIAFSTRLSR